MTIEDLEELHNINPVANLESVLKLGILSNARAAKLPHETVAMAEIQDVRATVIIPNTNRALHTYANLYINARNKMMYKRKELHRDLCVIRVSKDILGLPTVIISDQNASSKYVRFSNAAVGLLRIDKDQVFASSWTHKGDQIAEWRDQRCAQRF